MIQIGRRGAHRIARLAPFLILAEALGIVGCGNPEQGTVHVTPEARRELIPHAGPPSTAGKEQPVAGKSLSIKDRGKAVASP